MVKITLKFSLKAGNITLICTGHEIKEKKKRWSQTFGLSVFVDNLHTAPLALKSNLNQRIFF